MDTTFSLPSWRRLLAPSALVMGAVVMLILLLGGREAIATQRSAIPFPIPVFEIEAQSGSYQARLLNLPLRPVGVPQVMTPVDINGDLLPDVTVGVNLINAEGIFNNPPNIGEIIAPNIEINRLFTAPILSPGADPLRINVKFTVIDLEGQEPDIVVRFGYDTGLGGSIPPTYKAVLGGLENFFNPLRARIDTTGGLLIGLDPHLSDLGLSPQSAAYEGPLTTFAGLDTGPDLRADIDLRFGPMPDLIEVTYGSLDDGTQRFTYAHSHPSEVDLGVTGKIQLDTLHADIDARVDRLPRAIAVDFMTGENSGGVDYTSQTTRGRLPDLSAQIRLTEDGNARPLIARLDAESLPQTMRGQWNLVEGLPPEVLFDSSGQGIGAIEARIQNYDGAPSAFVPWVPDEQQHVSIQAGATGLLIDDTLIQARVERVRHAEIRGTLDGGIEGNVQIGDGERPLQVHGELDLRSEDLPYINATATIAPLPDSIDFAMTPSDDVTGRPLFVRYEPSETVDVLVEALVGLPETEGPLEIGDSGTIYADAQIFNVPASIEATILSTDEEMRVEVDAVPRPGAAPMDVFADVISGPLDDSGLPIPPSFLSAPIHASLAVQGIPAHLRMRMIENEAGDLERLDVRTCDVVWETGACIDEQPSDEVAELSFEARNWQGERGDLPVSLPAPPQSGPLYVTVTARGLPDTNELVLWEATGRMTDFRQLTYLGTTDMTAAKVNIGGEQDFRAYIDAQDIDLDGGSPDDGRISVDADIRIEHLPAPLTFCFSQNGRPIRATDATPLLDPITEACESRNPFQDFDDDDEPVIPESAPLTIAYRSADVFDVFADIVITGDFPFDQPELPVDFGTFDRLAADLDLTDVPGNFTAYVATPGDMALGDDGLELSATRVRTVAPGASNTSMNLTAELTTPGVRCADPNPEAIDGVAGAVCASVLIDSLPDYATVTAATVTDPHDVDDEEDDEVVALAGNFFACDLNFVGPDAGECRPGTAGSIGEIDVDIRAHAGTPSGVPTFVAPADNPHLYAVADLDDLSNFEIEAGLQVFDLRQVSFSQSPAGTAIQSDIGDGVKPLTVHAYADLRDAGDLVPELLRAQAELDVVLTPLPQQITIVQSGPLTVGDTETVGLHIDASEAALLTVDAEIRQLNAAPNAECASRGTYCLALEVDKLPQVFDASIVREFDPVVSNERDTRTFMFIEQERFDPSDDKADITVNAALGLPIALPVIGDGPVFADVVLTGVPNYLSVNMDTHENGHLNVDDEFVVDAAAIERVQIHSCQRNFDDEECEPGTEDQLDRAEASVRTFDLRPTDFPTPPEGDPPLYAGVAGRGDDLEAVVRIPDISEFQFINRDGLTGATARAGGGTDLDPRNLQVRVDIEDLLLAPEVEIGDIEVESPTVDIDLTVDVTPFPGELAFCMRESGLKMPLGTSGIPFVLACEDTNPFDEAQGPATTPLSIVFDANQDFDVIAAAEIAVNGIDEATDLPIPTQRTFGRVSMLDLPSDLILHFLSPAETDVMTDEGPATIPVGPYHATIETPEATSGVDISVAAGYLVEEGTVCEDPREGRSATCFSVDIVDLPTDVEFFYNPDLDPYDEDLDLADEEEMTNFTLHTNAAVGQTVDTQINNLKFSTINPPFDLPDLEIPLLGTLSTDAIVVEAEFDDLPQPFDLRGTLLLTDESPTAVFRVLDGESPGVDSLPGAQIHIRNFLSPDPTAGVIIPDRPVADDLLIDTYEITAIQRGPTVRVDADIVDVRSFGLEAIRSADDRKPLGTTAISVGLATDSNVRAYVDLMPAPGTRIIGDVLIGDVPATVEVCVRSARAVVPLSVPEVLVDDEAFPGTGTWCDDPANVALGEGALEAVQLPATDDRTMDLDVFARLEFGGGSSVVAARIDIDEMPQIVRARFGANGGRDVDVQAFQRTLNPGFDPIDTPDGIDRIFFEAATFDLDQVNTGIVGELPYDPIVNDNDAFPAEPRPADGREFVHAAADLSAGLPSLDDPLNNPPTIGFHVHGQIGRDDNVASSQLQSFRFSGLPCPVPENEPPDYPRSPTGDGTDYTCVKIGFDAAADSGENPLSLNVRALLPDSEAIFLHDAGISDLPPWIQIQIAQAETFLDPVNKRGWRRPCGPVADTSDTDPCMAPMVRFDQPVPDTFLFGVAEYGRIEDFHLLDEVDPEGIAPAFENIPNEDGWTDPDGNPEAPFNDGTNTDDRGILLNVVDFDNHTPTEFEDDRFVARASFRIPIPQSLTIDQVQTFTADSGTKEFGQYVNHEKADDFRFRAVIHDDEGQPVEDLGDLAAILHQADSGISVLLTAPCPGELVPNDATEPPPPCNEQGAGMAIPAEIAIALYLRENSVTTGTGDSRKVKDSTFIQIDGRLSTDLSLGARLDANGLEAEDGITLNTVSVALRNLPGIDLDDDATLHPHDPTFRLRVELDGGERAYPAAAPPPEPDFNPFGFETEVEIDVDQAAIGIDFNPTGTPARRIDVVITAPVPKIGADVHGYADVLGTTPAAFSLAASVYADPLNFTGKVVTNFQEKIDELVDYLIKDKLGAPDWLSEVIKFLLRPITAALDAFFEIVPVEVILRSRLLFQFHIDSLETFRLRNNILHAAMEGTGPGSATLGPVNLYVDQLYGGLTFNPPPVSIPDWICWVPGIPCSIDIPAIPLLGYGYLGGIGGWNSVIGVPLLLDFRDCTAAYGIGSILPFLGNDGFNSITLEPDDGAQRFVIWPGTDPRMSITGIIPIVFGWTGVTFLVDFLMDLVAGPLFCNAIFDLDGFAEVANTGTDPVTYNPGNPSAFKLVSGENKPTFLGNPVPGMPGSDGPLPEEQEAPDPDDPPVVEVPDLSDEPVGPPEAADPPVAPDLLYSGADGQIIDHDVSMCGVHEFNELTITAKVSVATAPVGVDAEIDTGPLCAAGDEGYLELRANELEVDAGGEINADGISEDVPVFDPDNDAVSAVYRATGSSGGTNAGIGGVGSSPSPGYQCPPSGPTSGRNCAYVGAATGMPDNGTPDDGTPDDTVYPGGPGSSNDGFGYPDLTDSVDSAGDGGNGGGVIVLRADHLLDIDGTLTADGVAGASNNGGACDANADDFNGDGVQFYDHDGDDESQDPTPHIPRPIVDPDYEHTGFSGSGGGAGGGIVLVSNYELDLTNAVSITAQGGPGGGGRLGNGGGGGGGAIKVIAPHQPGVTQATLVAGVTGGANGSATLCAGVPGAGAPSYAPGVPLEKNGVVVNFAPPRADVLPYGEFWQAASAGAPVSTIPAYYVGAGGPGTTQVNVCAVFLGTAATWDPDGAGAQPVQTVPDDPDDLAIAMNGVLPHVDQVVDDDAETVTLVQRGTAATAGSPCGGVVATSDDPHSVSGEAIQLITTVPAATPTMNGVHLTPEEIALDINTSGYYGVYTTAVRGGLIELITDVEWVFGVDAARPTNALTGPVANTVFTVGTASGVTFTSGDQADLSGLDHTECRTTGAIAADTTDWVRCTTSTTLPLLGADGLKTIEVRAFDIAGNVSVSTTRDVYLDRNPPEADIELIGGVQGGAATVDDNWYREAPSIRIDNYQAASPAGPNPFVYRFDNGFEVLCAADPCDIPDTTVDDLATGAHVVRYSAINSAGVRYRETTDPLVPHPMPSIPLYFDPEPPLVEIATVPLDPTFPHNAVDYFAERPYVVVSAIDQFGGSGIASRQFAFDGDTYEDFLPEAPPQAPEGDSSFCALVKDVAGNETETCIDIHVDSQAPAFTFAADSAPNGSGWYTTPPTFTVSGYDDGDGVAIDGDHFRARLDNGYARDCDPDCFILPAEFVTGTHLVHASAADRFDNRSGETTHSVLVDLDDPVVAPVIGPAKPDGERGWWHTDPFLSIYAFDPGEGSGIALIEYSLDGGTNWETWTEPVQVGAGEHTLCWRATDVAGRTSSVINNPIDPDDDACQDFFVDLHDPTAATTATPDPLDGWTASDVDLDASAADDSSGSGLLSDPAAVCEDLTPAVAATAISGLCISVDGGPYVPYTGEITAGEGIHTLRAYSVDRSGRRSAVAERTVRIDQSAPVIALRLLPPDPAENGWYRAKPLVILRATDGYQGSGIIPGSFEYRVDGAPTWTDYTQPFELGQGVHTVDARASDMVGTRTTSTEVKVDLTPPTAQALAPQRVLWLRLLQPTNNLNFRLGDNLSGNLRAAVVIYDATMNPIRRIDAGTIFVPPGTTVTRSVAWNGKDGSLLNLVPLGVYYYRVVVIDEAGNVRFSGESTRITIRLL